MALDRTRAFPSTGETDYQEPGMLLWDYYAAHALVGIVSSYDTFNPDDHARRAATYADAMMAERARRNTFSKEP